MKKPSLPRALALLAVALWLLVPGVLWAFTPPRLTGPVIDEAGVLSPDARQRIAAKLQAYRAEAGPQIQVYLPASLQGEAIEDVAYHTARTWKLGDAERDDGVLLVVAPKERKIRIETGQGVGDRITDLQANDIIRTQIAPRLKAGQWDQGVEAGVDSLGVLLGASSAKPPAQAQPGGVSLVFVLLPALIMIGLFVMASRRRGRFGAGHDAIGLATGMWLGGGGWSSGAGRDRGGWGGGGGFGGGGGWGGGGGGFGGGGSSGDF